MLNTSEQHRFDSKWKKAGDCHVWQDSLDRDGYGSFYLRKMNRRAHRVAYYSVYGYIGKGLIGHLCGNRACVNPEHLSIVTPRQNALEHSDSIPARNAMKTVCKNGHPFDKTWKQGNSVQRVCTICDRARKKRLRAKWKLEPKEII